MRVVSLLPSATEIVYGLGRSSALVGRSEECDYPEAVRRLPVVMRAKLLDPDRRSAEIDARVRASVRAGESLYTLDLGQLKSLAPDLLLTQDLCAVCSVTEEEVRAACDAAGTRPTILSVSPRRLSEVWESIERIGEAIGRGKRAKALASALEARTRPPERGRDRVVRRPRVAVVEWLDPPMLAGLWTPEIIECAGGRPVGPAPGGAAATVSWDELRTENPDLVVLSPCSFTLARTRRDLADARVRVPIGSLAPALRVWLADEAYFSRPGPRLADGVELLRALIDGRDPPRRMPVERWDGPGASG